MSIAAIHGTWRHNFSRVSLSSRLTHRTDVCHRGVERRLSLRVRTGPAKDARVSALACASIVPSRAEESFSACLAEREQRLLAARFRLGQQCLEGGIVPHPVEG